MGNIVDFSEWLKTEMEKRGWNAADLSRRSGVYPAQISRVLNKERGIGPESCLSFARALGLPPVEVFRRAGLLPGDADVSQVGEFVMEMRSIAESLTREEREQLLEMMYLFYRQARERREQYRTGDPAPDPA